MQFQEVKGRGPIEGMERQAPKEEIGAHKGCVTCPRSPTKLIADPGPRKVHEVGNGG